jgi:hypothetical protein
MSKLNGFTFLLLCTSILNSCSSNKNVLGIYRSNFAESGFFTSTMRLQPDSTFEYILQGDMQYDSSFGKFIYFDHKIFLTEIWRKTGSFRYSRIETASKLYKSANDSIKYQGKYLVGHNKLFVTNFITGQKIPKATGYHSRRKYLFFGSYLYSKRWYLNKIGFYSFDLH